MLCSLCFLWNCVFQVYVSMLDSETSVYTQKSEELVESLKSKMAATQVGNNTEWLNFLLDFYITLCRMKCFFMVL